MCNFNNLNDEDKEKYYKQLMEVVDVLGSKNAFLQLLEDVRRAKPHPLVLKSMKFSFSRGTLVWNKVIFQDKLALLLNVRVSESERDNFLVDEKSKEFKKVLNLVRTLAPIKFVIKAKSGDSSYELKAFNKIDEKTTLLNPIFDAIFFCSIDTIKKVLNFK